MSNDDEVENSSLSSFVLAVKPISHGILRTIFLIVKYVTNSVELLKIRRKKKKTILTLFHS